MHYLQKTINRLDSLKAKSDTVDVMHAYLLIGIDSQKIKDKSEELAKKFGAKIIEQSLVKIEEVRNLNNLVRLTITEPTLIFSPNIHEAGVEALNAFLKNLEQPQENLYFVLTAPTLKKVLPTIISRCEIIRINNSEELVTIDKDSEKFLNSSLSEKLSQTDKIKDREVAVEFLLKLINTLHTFIHENKVDYTSSAKNIESMTTTLNNLKANGNINLQLTNMVISLV
jgi:DNA polymerase III delta prime subunit